MVVINIIYQFIKPFLDNKMFILRNMGPLNNYNIWNLSKKKKKKKKERKKPISSLFLSEDRPLVPLSYYILWEI